MEELGDWDRRYCHWFSGDDNCNLAIGKVDGEEREEGGGE